MRITHRLPFFGPHSERELALSMLGFRDLVESWEFRLHDGRDELYVTIDWPGVEELLDDRVRRLIPERPSTAGWTVSSCRYLADLGWLPNPRAQNISMAHLLEHCRVAGPNRWSVVGSYPDWYRALMSAEERDEDGGPWIEDADDSLEALVERIVRFVETGEANSRLHHFYPNDFSYGPPGEYPLFV